METWNRVFSEMYPELASNWTHNTGNGSKANNTYTMGPIPDFFWTAIFSVMLVVAIFGNLIVFWIVLGNATDVHFTLVALHSLKRKSESRPLLGNYFLKINEFLSRSKSFFIKCLLERETITIPGHRRMQNVTNYFLVNLSCADLMMSCLNTAFNFTFMKSR